jgi:23S rRNA (adenine2030-N6)-methyltransferase
VNYQHAFHAGNFADCFKHAVLVELLRALTEKPAPLSYIETHAGSGRYLLDAAPSEKTGEFKEGIEKLYDVTALPPELHRYVEQVRRLNSFLELSAYPGSPYLAGAMLRPDDKLQLIELQDEPITILKHCMGRDARVRILQQDGYAALKSLLPPMPKRALIMIDPPFEQRNEWDVILDSLEGAFTRLPTGVFMIWFPIKIGREMAQVYRKLRDLCARFPIKSALAAEFCIHPDETALRLNGCGIVLINPPFKFEQTLERLQTPLHRLLKVEPRARAGWQWLKQAI